MSASCRQDEHGACVVWSLRHPGTDLRWRHHCVTVDEQCERCTCEAAVCWSSSEAETGWRVDAWTTATQCRQRVHSHTR